MVDYCFMCASELNFLHCQRSNIMEDKPVKSNAQRRQIMEHVLLYILLLRTAVPILIKHSFTSFLCCKERQSLSHTLKISTNAGALRLPKNCKIPLHLRFAMSNSVRFRFLRPALDTAYHSNEQHNVTLCSGCEVTNLQYARNKCVTSSPHVDNLTSKSSHLFTSALLTHSHIGHAFQLLRFCVMLFTPCTLTLHVLPYIAIFTITYISLLFFIIFPTR